MQYRVWQLVSLVMARLPLPVAYAVATAIGYAGFYCWPRARRSMQRNFAHVLPGAGPDTIRRTARASLINYCRYLADFVRFPSLSPGEVRAQVDWGSALENLDRTLQRGKGALIVCMHFGNWDAGAGAAAAAGYPLTVVAESFQDPRLDTMVVGSRQRLGMSVVKMEKAAPSLIRSLRRNGLLALLIDRPVPGEGVRVPFFGCDVEVPAGPARLAMRTGATIVPTAFARVAPGKSKFVALTDFTIDYEPTGDDEHDIRTLTRSILAAQERFIQLYPDQWYMFREMWPCAGQRAG